MRYPPNVLWALLACVEPPPGPPEVLLVTTRQLPAGLSHPPLMGAIQLQVPMTGVERADLASLLTGTSHHGLWDESGHRLGCTLHGVEGNEDWPLDPDGRVHWRHVDDTADVALDAETVVLVGLKTGSAVWWGEPPRWSGGATLAEIGGAVRRRAQIPPFVCAVPRLENPQASIERRQVDRLDPDVLEMPLFPRRRRSLERVGEALDRRHLTEAADRLDALPPGPASVALAAELATLRGHPYEGLDLLTDQYARTPSATAALVLADAWRNLRSDRAFPWYREVLRLHPGQPDAVLALFEHEGGEDRLAWLWIHAPAHAARAECHLEPAHCDTAEGAWARGEVDEALDRLDVELADQPRDIPRRVLRARWALELGDAALAERLLAPVARWMPRDREVRAMMRQARTARAAERAGVAALRREWRRRHR